MQYIFEQFLLPPTFLLWSLIIYPINTHVFCSSSIGSVAVWWKHFSLLLARQMDQRLSPMAYKNILLSPYTPHMWQKCFITLHAPPLPQSFRWYDISPHPINLQRCILGLDLFAGRPFDSSLFPNQMFNNKLPHTTSSDSVAPITPHGKQTDVDWLPQCLFFFTIRVCVWLNKYTFLGYYICFILVCHFETNSTTTGFCCWCLLISVSRNRNLMPSLAVFSSSSVSFNIIRKQRSLSIFTRSPNLCCGWCDTPNNDVTNKLAILQARVSQWQYTIKWCPFLLCQPQILLDKHVRINYSVIPPTHTKVYALQNTLVGEYVACHGLGNFYSNDICCFVSEHPIEH